MWEYCYLVKIIHITVTKYQYRIYKTLTSVCEYVNVCNEPGLNFLK